MKASLKNYRQAPRKVRLLANLVRGKKVEDALTQLSFADQKAAQPFSKLIESAVANAKESGISNKENLFIKSVRVDEGLTFMRYRARARGTAAPIRKRSSHIALELAEKVAKPVVKKEAPKKTVAKKAAKKAAPKAEK